MLRRVAAKALWLTKGAALFGGAVVTLALVLGVASVALGANGSNFILGRVNNTATALTKLTGNVDGAALQVQNNNAGTNDQALNLQVQPGESPMRVNSATKVANLNADLLDGKDITAFDADEVIGEFGPLPAPGTYTSKGGTLIISTSGSGYRDSFLAQGPGRIGMDLLVDGSVRAILSVPTNELDSHKAFVPDFTIVEGLPAGDHTIGLEAKYSATCNTTNEDFYTACTTTDNSDYFNVTVVRIPD